MKKRVIVMGGGVAGMQTALRLAARGIEAVIVEKETELGGKLRGWHVLFPSFTPAGEVLSDLRRRVNEAGIEVMAGVGVRRFTSRSVELADGRTLACDAVVLATGFTLFDASIKEEYGYGIYDNVFTTVDIERMLNEGRVAKADGTAPRRIAFLHCVGSRDEKVCQQHCSRVCCITGVKQAMEMKRLFPEADVFNFYMDIRMFGPGYEEMYREAQQRCNIHFVRGRISEASPTIDGRVQIKAEDTLTGRPLRMSVDMLVLIVGMRANDDNPAFAASAGLRQAPSGFMAPRDLFLGNVSSGVEGIFYAGTVTAPKNIGESLNEGTAAADAVAEYLQA
ncbi:FAD-dependent oxidoreductase [uncultured Alistipes sp.]|uniref:FAD-dependent oxidoreductase n=1 Tax=uncultured Alistipes sp. TaxID=538949 RepID=UPI002664FA84|nr:FAD-dependent oxidoreductase [uncultured Alistipes sp.]